MDCCPHCEDDEMIGQPDGSDLYYQRMRLELQVFVQRVGGNGIIALAKLGNCNRVIDIED